MSSVAVLFGLPRHCLRLNLSTCHGFPFLTNRTLGPNILCPTLVCRGSSHSDSDSDNQHPLFNVCVPQPSLSLSFPTDQSLLDRHDLHSRFLVRGPGLLRTIPRTPNTRCFHRGFHNFLTRNLLDLLCYTRRLCHDSGRSIIIPSHIRFFPQCSSSGAGARKRGLTTPSQRTFSISRIPVRRLCHDRGRSTSPPPDIFVLEYVLVR